MNRDNIWTIVIEFNQTLREHILLFPRDQWLFPNFENKTENRYWRGFFMHYLGCRQRLPYFGNQKGSISQIENH